ncbi:MAG: CoA pyrophosphatase [Burkholderiales bacterium]|nr:CoA pyrophosphatase [Burkholderiales bacterium]
MSASQPQNLTISTEEARKLAPHDPVLYNAGLAPVTDLTPAGLRERFRAPRAWHHETLGDMQFAKAGGAEQAAYRRAAVLVPIVARSTLSLLLTERPAHLRQHAGQISFPGGRAEDGDRDAAETALREAGEEVGLTRDRVEVIGELPEYLTVTNYRVTPVVALVHPPFELAPDAGEVAEAFEVPLAFLLDPANHQRRSRPWQGGERHFYAMPYGERFIWGATAAMLRNLYHFLRV